MSRSGNRSARQTLKPKEETQRRDVPRRHVGHMRWRAYASSIPLRIEQDTPENSSMIEAVAFLLHLSTISHRSTEMPPSEPDRVFSARPLVLLGLCDPHNLVRKTLQILKSPSISH
jgi:hypothetical protein